MKEVFSNRREHAILSGAKRNFWGIILAGGEGKRLRNFIAKIFGHNKPKQYCNITGTNSMIRQTRDRALKVIPREKIITILNTNDLPLALEEIGDQPPETFVVQPENKDTSAGILLPLLKINKRDKNAIVATFPSDHYIHDESRFMQYVNEANKFVKRNPEAIVLLGIRPGKYESGYGWIEIGKPIYSNSMSRINMVNNFWEKPDEKIAMKLMANGSLWNTFVIVGTSETFIKHIKEQTPEVYRPLASITKYFDTVSEVKKINMIYESIPSVNFSSSVLEKIKNQIYVMEVPDVYWSDWGEEHRIYLDAKRFGFSLAELAENESGKKLEPAI